ncbi:MAG: HAD family hydrolase [Saprospiraceae bacterium]
MDLSAVKLVISDMDGTLLNSNHEASPRFYELYEQMKAKGITFIPASGRQYHSMREKLAPIADELLIVAENGAFAKSPTETMVSTFVPDGTVASVLAAIQGHDDIHPVLCTPNAAYVKANSPKFQAVMSEFYSSHNAVEDLAGVEVDVLKIALYNSESSERYIYPHTKHLEGPLKVKVSGLNWVDVSHPDAHKGYAIRMIQKQLGVSKAETMVFGDYHNDIEMLALADFSFAMGNAHPDIVAAANFQTTNNDDLGVERVLERLLEAHG